MGLWFPLALMTAAAVGAVLWPLGRGRIAKAPGGELAVYCDQMRELARDRAAGLIGRAEAEAARVEVARRLLAADAAERARPAVALPWRRLFAGLAAVVALPIGAFGLYLALGAPDLPDRPLAARIDAPPESRTLAGDRKASHPQDGAKLVGMKDRP